jgi:hypothetical protein
MSIFHAPAGLLAVGLAVSLAACSKGPSQAWAGPGWYLQLPYTVIWGGPAVYGGPFTYDECEAKRAQEIKPERFLCVNENKQPTKYGFY